MSDLVLAKPDNAIEVYQKPQIPEAWSYEDSIKRTESIVYKRKALTDVLANELWIAREKLSTRAWNKKSDDANAPSLTWNDYCIDIGVDKSTVNRWLSE